MADKKFLGSGMNFPLQVNPATGRVSTSSAESSVKESIYLILMTAISERLARPSFGTNLNQYMFMDINQTTLNIMTRDLHTRILSQEPRVDQIEVLPHPDLDNGRLIVEINYYLAGSHQPGSLVFPFYLRVDDTPAPEEAPEEFLASTKEERSY